MLLPAHVDAPEPIDIRPMFVELVALPRAADPGAPPSQAQHSPAARSPQRQIAKLAPPSPDIDPLSSGEGPAIRRTVELSEAQLASATRAGSGSTSRCSMATWLQNAMRRDSLVQGAAAEALRAGDSPRKAILVWNGDWVRHSDQEGKGLAAIREAIMWEVAFAPAACRANPVRGLILITLNDTRGSANLVLGARYWRWSDLLTSRPRLAGEGV